MVAAHHDWWAKTYDLDYFGRFALYHRVTWDNIRRFLPKNKDSLILDAGGGTGIWSIELAKLGYRLVLTDISEGMLERARKKIEKFNLGSNIEIRISNICNMIEFPDENFDMIICEGDPLSYCGDHQRALMEFERVVKPSGIVIASIDNRVAALEWFKDKNDLNAVQRFLETGEIQTPQEQAEFCYSIHTFTVNELKELFQSRGLLVERIIGKLVIAHRLPGFKSKDPVIQEGLYKLEIQYNNNPAFYPWAGHLEIVGRKEKKIEKL